MSCGIIRLIREMVHLLGRYGVHEYKQRGTSVDTEGSELSEITVRGEDAILNMKNGYCTLIWSQRNVLCQLYGKIDKEEAIRIAENIEIFFLDEMK